MRTYANTDDSPADAAAIAPLVAELRAAAQAAARGTRMWTYAFTDESPADVAALAQLVAELRAAAHAAALPMFERGLAFYAETASAPTTNRHSSSPRRRRRPPLPPGQRPPVPSLPSMSAPPAIPAMNAANATPSAHRTCSRAEGLGFPQAENLILEVPRPSAVRWGAVPSGPPRPFAFCLSLSALALVFADPWSVPDGRPFLDPTSSFDSYRRTLTQYIALAAPFFCPLFAPSPVVSLVVVRPRECPFLSLTID